MTNRLLHTPEGVTGKKKYIRDVTGSRCRFLRSGLIVFR